MSTSAVKAGEAFVEVSLRDKIKEGARRIQSQLNAVSAGFKTFGTGLAAAGASAAAAFGSIAGAIGAAAINFAASGSELADMSARTGIAAESLSALGYAAKLSGSDLGQVEGALRKMQKLLGDAAGGSKEASEKLTSLGLSTDKLLKLSPEKQFATISAAIRKIKDPTIQAATAMEVFGKTATQILPLINSDIAATTAEARKLGIVMSNEDAAAADALGDSIDTLKTTFVAIYNSIGAAVAGPLTQFANVASQIAGTVAKWVSQNRSLFVAISAVALAGAAAGAIILSIGGAIVAAGVAIAGIGAAIPSLAALATFLAPAIPVIAGVAAALAAVGATYAGLLYVANQAGILKAVFDGVSATFSQLYGTLTQTFGGIARALSAGEYQKAAETLWAGLRLAFFQGAKSALDAFSWLFTNGLSMAGAFAKTLAQTLWNVFKSIPNLLASALTGGASLAEILAKSINGGLAIGLHNSIADAQAELDRLTATEKAKAGQPGKGNAGSTATETQATTAAAVDNSKAINDRIAALRDETNELRLGANAFDLLKLKQQGATTEQLKQVQMLQAQRDAIKAKTKADEDAKAKAKELADRGKQLAEEVRSPFQVFQAKIKELDTLLAAGSISSQTYRLQKDRAANDFQGPMRDALKNGRNTIADINTQASLDVVLRTRASYIGGAPGKSKAEETALSQLEEQRRTNAILERGASTTIKIQTRRL